MNGKQRKNEEKALEMNAIIKREEEDEDEIQILETEITNSMPTSSNSSSNNLACQNQIVSEGNNDEKQNNLMDLLAELSQHFAASVKESKTVNEGESKWNDWMDGILKKLNINLCYFFELDYSLFWFESPKNAGKCENY